MDEREDDSLKEQTLGDPAGDAQAEVMSVVVPEATKPSGEEAMMPSDIAENSKTDCESTATDTGDVLEDLANAPVDDTGSSEDMSFSATEVELLRHKCSQLESTVTMMKHELER
jgi:hypothetical protein